MEVKKQKTLSLKDSFIRQMEKDILSGRLSVGQKLPSERTDLSLYAHASERSYRIFAWMAARRPCSR